MRAVWPVNTPLTGAKSLNQHQHRASGRGGRWVAAIEAVGMPKDGGVVVLAARAVGVDVDMDVGGSQDSMRRDAEIPMREWVVQCVACLYLD